MPRPLPLLPLQHPFALLFPALLFACAEGDLTYQPPGGAAGSDGAGGEGGEETILENPPILEELPWLHVEGNQILDPTGTPVVLRGVSLIDLGVTEAEEGGVITMINRLTNANDDQGSSPGWYPTVLRLPIYPSDSKAGVSSPYQYENGDDRYYETVLRPVVDHCRKRGVYAIIDWHDIDDTSARRESTAAFWRDIAPRFANDSHVIFELFNEPVNRDDWQTVRADMQVWYDIVRGAAPKNLILVAGPEWSQQIAWTATDPVQGTNIAYVSHMYPYHFGVSQLREEVTTAAAVHPVFMSEWGFEEGSEYIVDGTISSYGEPFREFVEELGLSWTGWCASASWYPRMFESGHVLRVGEGQMGGFLKDWLYERRHDDRPRVAD